MNQNTITAAKSAKKAFLSAYGLCIGTILTLLKKSRIDFVDINYDILECRCYNVNNTSGEYDANPIDKVAIDKETETLNVYDISGNEYNVGKNENGQDGYTLVNPDVLLQKVTDYVEAFQKRLILVPKRDYMTMLKGIQRFIGKDGNFSFEHGFPRPKLQNNETVVEINSREVHTCSYDKQSHWYWLRDLKARELKVLIDAINEYMLYLHNEA